MTYPTTLLHRLRHGAGAFYEPLDVLSPEAGWWLWLVLIRNHSVRAQPAISLFTPRLGRAGPALSLLQAKRATGSPSGIDN